MWEKYLNLENDEEKLYISETRENSLKSTKIRVNKKLIVYCLLCCCFTDSFDLV